MRVERRGGNTPEVAIVGGVHGDEPCGKTAIERTLDADLTFRRPVAFVVANEEALAAGTRYVDEDLNRAFPGDPEGDTHESRLAAQLSDLLGGCQALGLHSTQSYGSAFAIVGAVDDFAREICPRLSIEAVVTAGEFVRGRIFAGVPRTIEVECGYQGSPAAADTATTIVREFLAATGAIDEPANPQRDVPVYELTKSIEKGTASDYEVYASNFEKVPAGEAFAAADGEPVHAREAFYPVLMSPYGYDDLFGYAATRVDTLP